MATGLTQLDLLFYSEDSNLDDSDEGPHFWKGRVSETVTS